MKHVLVIFFGLILLTSCNEVPHKNETKQEAINTEIAEVEPRAYLGVKVPSEYLSPVDTSKVHTLKDWQNVKQSLYKEYDALKTQAYKKYDQKKIMAWKIYSRKKDSAISIIRSNHNQLYISWLDAKEMNDYDEQFKIEKSPEFKPLQIANKWYNENYTTIDDEGWKEYSKIDNEAWKEFSDKEHLAWRAYQSR